MQDWYAKKGVSDRAGLAIVTELNKNLDDLIKKRSNNNDKDLVHFTYSDEPQEKEIRFLRYYLDAEAYKSVLTSGSFTHFHYNFQYELTNIYNRIKFHNDLLSYRNRFEDIFFLYDESPKRVEKWWRKVRRYDTMLTNLEQDLIVRLKDIKTSDDFKKFESKLKDKEAGG